MGQLAEAEQSWRALLELMADAPQQPRAALALTVLLDALGAVLVVADADSARATSVYGPTRKIYGHPPDRLLLEPLLWQQVILYATPRREVLAELTPGTLHAREYQIVRPDGHTLWVEQQCRLLQPERQVLVLVRDITASKVTAHQWQDLESRAAVLIGNHNDAQVVIDQQGCVVSFNARAERMFGCLASSILGQQVDMLLTPECRPFLAACFAGQATGGYRLNSAALVGLNQFCGRFPLEAFAFVSGSQPERCVLLLRNLTDQLQTEVRFYHLSRAIGQIPLSVHITDLEGQLCYANSKFYELHGLDTGNLPLLSSATAQSSEQAMLRWKRLMAGQEWQEERLIRRRDGSSFWAAVKKIPIHDYNGAISHILTLREDISAKKQQEELERQSQEQLAHSARLILLGEMASMLAHEVNQPLTAIAGYSSACRQELPEHPDQALAYLAKLETQVKRAGDMVWRMREFSRSHPMPRSLLDLNELIHEVHDWLGHKAHNLNASLVAKVAPPPLPRVQGDRLQIEQVLVNLVNNALDAVAETEEERERRIEIAVTARPDDAALMVSVRDTGSGIALHNARHLFEPFFTTKATGVGLGLAICRSIVEDHGGQLWHDAAPDGGTIFHFTLPVAA
jgi:two-component system sensor histidine kinase DctS